VLIMPVNVEELSGDLSKLDSHLADSPKSPKEKKPKKGKNADAGDKKRVTGELKQWPEYIQKRLEVWERAKKRHEEELAAKVPEDITITLPDGKHVQATSWRTTPYEIAKNISQGLADSTVVAKIDDKLWDLDRPLESGGNLKLLKFDTEEGQHAFWHSSAHMLGEALERVYGGSLCYGPPVENGFFYDMYLEEDNPVGNSVSNLDFPVIETCMKSIVKEKQPFERLELYKEELLEMFAYNKFKLRLLNEKVTTEKTTAYRCGPLIDLCRGPHVRHTGKVKALQVTKNSAAYWEGKADAEGLQRVYGISFPDKKQLKEWQDFQAEAAKRDHRKIGREQELFFFHEMSPGSCFFLPKGAVIYNRLLELVREQYHKRGYNEVISPNIYNSKLWETSGHWQHYKENMFAFGCEKETFALKPMNCPGHCLMFDMRNRSWRELPIRMADFGVLHRNELSGALTGLTRVRRFQQDDAHIFCTVDQIKDEISGCLDFMRFLYTIFGFTFQLNLSTRPEKYMGDIKDWDMAEKQLEESLNEFGYPWKLNPEDGAFYGPKIDITIQDALKRSHQCATIQLDFQLPLRFNLNYTGDDGEKKRPVMVHRALLGSIERSIAVLTESFGGKWPFWLSPRQAILIPVATPFDDYAKKVSEMIFDAGFLCEVDTDPGDTMNKKIRNAQLAQYNFILVVGERERSSETVNVRTRDNKVHGERTIAQVIERFQLLKQERIRLSEDEF